MFIEYENKIRNGRPLEEATSRIISGAAKINEQFCSQLKNLLTSTYFTDVIRRLVEKNRPVQLWSSKPSVEEFIVVEKNIP